jgi:hypothetical protein
VAQSDSLAHQSYGETSGVQSLEKYRNAGSQGALDTVQRRSQWKESFPAVT